MRRYIWIRTPWRTHPHPVTRIDGQRGPWAGRARAVRTDAAMAAAEPDDYAAGGAGRVRAAGNRGRGVDCRGPHRVVHVGRAARPIPPGIALAHAARAPGGRVRARLL